MQHRGLRDAGLKVTAARVKILNMLETAPKQHMNAEEVYQSLLAQGEEVGLATVYRVLMQFSSAGLVKRHTFEGDSAVFEIDRGEHHDHMVCLHCHIVLEFVDDEIEKRQEAIAAKYQFELVDHNLNMYGVCSDCSKKIGKK